jgi:predicted transcriptional regulator of viral defense system
MYVRYGDLVVLAGKLPWFDLPLVVQAFGGHRSNIRVQLSRWIHQGKVVALRRGMYTLPDTYRKAPVAPAGVSNALYRPSYLSGLWALSFHDLIPERVVWLTAVSPRVPRRFENPLGVFEYRSIKQALFFGYAAIPYGGQEILVADPAKALLDHWHLAPGEWTVERLAEMRCQNVDKVSAATLRAYCVRFNSPRLSRAVERWMVLAAESMEGTEQL